MAFDTGWHNGFLLKLKTNFPVLYNLFFKSYLNDSTFVVKLETLFFGSQKNHSRVTQAVLKDI